jgi:phage tail-like protein
MSTKSAKETVIYPFVAFNFSVEIRVDGVAMQVCDAAFSECDGLEMTMEVKTIREGGNNGKQIRLTGPLNFGQVTLKRGMTETFDLWKWMNLMLTNPETRADAEVVVFAPDGKTERARFILWRVVPVKLKAPPLNAKDGTVAIEELQLAYESLSLKDDIGTSGQ